MMKKQLLELMIWLHSSTGEHQLSQIFLYVYHTLKKKSWSLFLKRLYLSDIHFSHTDIFQVSDYDKEIEIMKTVTKEEYLASLRR